MNSLESFVKFIPSSSNASITIRPAQILTDMEFKARKFTSGLNEMMYEVSNEPSLGLYRIQEHVRKNIPSILERSVEAENFKQKIQGSIFDLDYSLDAVAKVANSDLNFDSITRLLTDSLYSARQINIRNMRASSNSSNAEEKSSRKYVDLSNELYSSKRDEKNFSISGIFTSKSFKNASMSINENLSQSMQRSQTIDITPKQLSEQDKHPKRKLVKEKQVSVEAQLSMESPTQELNESESVVENVESTNEISVTQKQVETIVEEIINVQ